MRTRLILVTAAATAAALGTALLGSSVTAQPQVERTACADSYSERLALVRAALEQHAEARLGTPFVPPRDAANEACATDDALHRASLVWAPGDPLGQLEVMCYGDPRTSCTNARRQIADARRRLRVQR